LRVGPIDFEEDPDGEDVKIEEDGKKQTIRVSPGAISSYDPPEQ